MDEVADVLERAADLYESEQIDWCQGWWGRTFQYQEDGTTVQGQFHCAEGALLRAAGFDMQSIMDSQRSSLGYCYVSSLLETPVVEAAMNAVNKQLGPQVGRLYDYNDNLNQYTAKQQLIEVFKEAAKGLRNVS